MKAMSRYKYSSQSVSQTNINMNIAHH